MLEFKLQYYFEKYKESCILSTSVFKKNFIRENGDFELLNELMIMIQRYQIKKYGDLFSTGKRLNRKVRKGTYSAQERVRNYKRFGTREERIRRKLEEKRK